MGNNPIAGAQGDLRVSNFTDVRGSGHGSVDGNDRVEVGNELTTRSVTVNEFVSGGEFSQTGTPEDRLRLVLAASKEKGAGGNALPVAKKLSDYVDGLSRDRVRQREGVFQGMSPVAQSLRLSSVTREQATSEGLQISEGDGRSAGTVKRSIASWCRSHGWTAADFYAYNASLGNDISDKVNGEGNFTGTIYFPPADVANKIGKPFTPGAVEREAALSAAYMSGVR